jgi:hypothetical protein
MQAVAIAFLLLSWPAAAGLVARRKFARSGEENEKK